MAKVVIQLLANISNAISGLQKVSAAAEGMGGKLKSIGSNISGLGEKMAIGVSAPIVAGLGLATKSAIDFEKQMAGISRATGIKGLESDVKSLSAQFGLLPPQFGEITEEVAKAGVSGKQSILEISQTVAKASVLIDLPAKQTAESFGKVASVYKLSGKEIEKFAASINYLGDEIGGKESEILKIVAASGATASAAKMSAAEITALGAVYGRLGVEASTAANSIKTQVGAILEASTGQNKKYNAVLQQVGLSYQKLDAIIQKKGMSAAILELNTRMGKLKGSAQSIAIATLYGNNYNDTIGLSIGRTDLLAEAFKKAGNDSAALAKSQREWAQTQATTAYQMQVIQSKLQSIGITIGAAILPSVGKLLSAVAPLVDRFGKFADANPKIIQMGVAFLAVAAAIGPVLIGIGSVISAVGAVASAIGVAIPVILGIGTAMLTVVGIVVSVPGAIAIAIAAVVAAVVAAGFAIYKNWDWLKSQASAIWKSISSATISAVNAVGTGLSKAFSATVSFIKQLPNMVSYAVGYAIAAVALFPVRVAAALAQSVLYVIDNRKKIVGAIASTLSAIGNAITGFVRSIPGMINGVLGAIGSLLAKIPPMIAAGFNALTRALASLPSIIWNAMKGAYTAVTSALSSIMNYIIQVGSWLLKSLANIGAGMMNAFAAGIRNAASAPFKAIQDVVSRVRAYLPSSDAKLGALSDLTASGSALPRTFAYGMAKTQPVEKAAAHMAQAASPKTVAPPPTSGGNKTITLNFTPQISLSGGATNTDAKKLIEQLRPYARELLLMLNQSSSRQGRTAF